MQPLRQWGGGRVRSLAALLGILAGGLAGAAPARAADPQIRVQVDRPHVAVGGVIVLTVSLEGFSGRAEAACSRPECPPPIPKRVTRQSDFDHLGC